MGTLSAFSAFKGEGRHQSLKSEIRQRSFKGGRVRKGGPAYEGHGEHKGKGGQRFFGRTILIGACMPMGSMCGNVLGPARKPMARLGSIGKGLCSRGKAGFSSGVGDGENWLAPGGGSRLSPEWGGGGLGNGHL